jgi:hypothetical protein
MQGNFEHGNEPLDPLEYGEFPYRLKYFPAMPFFLFALNFPTLFSMLLLLVTPVLRIRPSGMR